MFSEGAFKGISIKPDSELSRQNVITEIDGLEPVKTHKEFLALLNILIASKIRIQHTYNKLSSLSNSRTRLLPHQIEAAYRVVNSLKHRFLIADEVGLGKTIEAGLIMKELMLRYNYKNILIVVPSTLQLQWKQELQNKFNEDFDILHSKNIHTLISKNFYKIITSIDFIKNPKYYENILSVSWDIVIFDEAHRLRRDYNKITKAYSFAEKISEITKSLLLLSATPFRGKLEELYYLVRLLDPHLLGPEQSFFQEFVIPAKNGNSLKHLKEKISRILIRRTKQEVGGFTKRVARTVRFDLSPEERLLYEETTEYVKKEYSLSQETQNRAVGFVMIVFQKLLDSSTRSLLRALEKRKQALETKLFQNYVNDFDSIDETLYFEEEEIYENYYRQNSHYDIHTLRKEILTLSRLISLGKNIKKDTKLLKLKELLFSLKSSGYKKFIIFTQFRSTQDYLYEMLKEFKCNIFHGSLNTLQKEQEIQEFKENGEILISTEAGGEGRNLQFCNVLINYDLPWSPLKIEQRIGRIHRFGQKDNVLIINFSTRNTVSEKVLSILEEKIRIFEESLGPSDVLLGAIEEDLDFQQLIMEFVTGRITQKELHRQIETRIDIAKKSYSLLSSLVSPKIMDFNWNDYYEITKQEREINNRHIEKITLQYLKEEKKSHILKKVKDRKHDIYILQPQNKYAVFDSGLALENEHYEFLAIGHPVVDEALQYYLRHPLQKGMVKFHHEKLSLKGIIFVYLFHYGHSQQKDNKEILYVYVPSLFSSHFEILKSFALEELYLKSGNLQKIKILPFLPNEREKVMKKAREVSSWLAGELRKKNTEWYNRINEHLVSEYYKVEISYGQKIRNLEEKKDIEKLRYKNQPTPERKARLTRIENQIQTAKKELDAHLQNLHQNATIHLHLELLQVYWSS